MPETKMAPDTRGREAMLEEIARLEADLLSHRQQTRAKVESAIRLVLDAAPVMIWAIGPDAGCTFFNQSWLEFRGRSLEQELGKGWAEGLHPEDRELCLATQSRYFEARRGFRIQFRLLRADGEYRWVEATGVPRHEEDEFCGFLGAATDVTSLRGAFAPDQQALRAVFSLTERERQVLALIAEGKSTREAALKLNISYKTADSHRSRILEKLGVHETATLVRYAIRAGLILP